MQCIANYLTNRCNNTANAGSNVCWKHETHFDNTRCRAVTQKGVQCKCTASKTSQYCGVHQPKPPSNKRYYIRIQERCAYNGKFPRDNWRAYRKWSAWPTLFTCPIKAQEFMNECFHFKGIVGRKMAASIAMTRVKL